MALLMSSITITKPSKKPGAEQGNLFALYPFTG